MVSFMELGSASSEKEDNVILTGLLFRDENVITLTGLHAGDQIGFGDRNVELVRGVLGHQLRNGF